MNKELSDNTTNENVEVLTSNNFTASMMVELINETNIKHDCQCYEVTEKDVCELACSLVGNKELTKEECTPIYDTDDNIVDVNLNPSGAIKIALQLDDTLMPYVIVYIGYVLRPELLGEFQHPFTFNPE